MRALFTPKIETMRSFVFTLTDQHEHYRSIADPDAFRDIYRLSLFSFSPITESTVPVPFPSHLPTPSMYYGFLPFKD